MGLTSLMNKWYDGKHKTDQEKLHQHELIPGLMSVNLLRFSEP